MEKRERGKEGGKRERKERKSKTAKEVGKISRFVQNGSCSLCGHPMHTYMYADLTSPLSHPVFAFSFVSSPSTSTSLSFTRPFHFPGGL